MNATPQGGTATAADLVDAEIDLSCRIPLLVLFGAAAFWLVFSSLLGLLASMKFHVPTFLADVSWLTYGRMRPTANDSFLYGFLIPSGLGVALWILARLGRTRLAQPLLLTVGVGVWNLGVLLGVVGILIGDGTGYEWFDMPRYAALFLFLGYLIIAVLGLITFHLRERRSLAVSQWFLLAAIFWFPWVFSTATMLLLVWPVRGVTQAVVAWWYVGNIFWLWLTLIGLGTLFFFLPRFARREVANYTMAAFSFWILLIFASWIGVPNSAPVPAALPAASTVGSVFMGFAVMTLLLNLYQTLGRWSVLKENIMLRFAGIALLSFVCAVALNVIGSISQVADYTDLTSYPLGLKFLQSYGFTSLILFGAIYHIVPQLLDIALADGVIAASVARLARLNLWLAILGLIFTAVPFVIGGVIQGTLLNNSKIPFDTVLKTNLMVIRTTTIGDLLIFAANLMFMLGLGRLVTQFYKARAAAAYAEATAIIPGAGVKA
jgi:cytochrome c oxidase cbb3-type subunit I